MMPLDEAIAVYRPAPPIPGAQCRGLVRQVRIGENRVRWTSSCRAGCYRDRMAADYQRAREQVLEHIFSPYREQALQVLEGGNSYLDPGQRRRLQAVLDKVPVGYIGTPPTKASKPAVSTKGCLICEGVPSTANIPGELHTHPVRSGLKTGGTLRPALLLQQGGVCLHCRRPMQEDSAGARDLGLNPTLEHLWPKAFGGPNHEWNLAVACASCNNHRAHQMTKQVMDLLYERVGEAKVHAMFGHTKKHFGIMLLAPRRVS